MDVIAHIDALAQQYPDRPAHISAGRCLTYGELRTQSDALARRLTRTLPAGGAPVAVIGHKQPEMLVAFLAAVKAGRPYVPIDTGLPPQRIERIVTLSGAALALTPDRVAELLAADDASEALALSPVDPDDPFYIIFTSGSTGEPKGVVITHACLSSFVAWMLSEHGFVEGGETFLNQAPFSFDLSVMDLYLSLVTGGTLFSVTGDDIASPRQLHKSLAASDATVWVSTPSFAAMCLAERTFAAPMLPHLRRFLFCGETLAPDVAAQLLDRFPGAEVWNTYGPTEATVATTSVCIDREILARCNPLPVGFVKPDARILILDDAGRPLPPSEPGEIAIVGPNVSVGYLGRPDLTARAFFAVDGERAYRTGDRGHLAPDGLLFFAGRLDYQVKLHGYRIELGDIEANLRALPGVRDAVVLPREKDGHVDSLVAFVVLAEPLAGSAFERTVALKKDLGQRLPAYMVPSKFRFLDAFPMTPNGKADRRMLTESLG
ncbi:MAG: D-alanine--poly(phosphoribitol) ligase subunit DltA [Anaerolineae bacterium]